MSLGHVPNDDERAIDHRDVAAGVMPRRDYKPIAFLEAFGRGASEEELMALIDDMDANDRDATERILTGLRLYYTQKVLGT